MALSCNARVAQACYELGNLLPQAGTSKALAAWCDAALTASTFAEPHLDCFGIANKAATPQLRSSDKRTFVFADQPPTKCVSSPP